MRLKTLICFFLLFFFSFSKAQIIDLNLVYFGKDIGLSNSLFTCITQDKAGYIWIGTQDGLNRYDGYSVKVYKHNDQIPNSLPNSYIRSIFTDSYGTIWIGTDRGLCKYKPEYDGFEIVEILDLDSPGALPKITEIAENQSGKLFFSSAAILYKIDLSNGQIERFITLERGDIHALAFDLHDNIWIGSLHDGGLLKYDYSGKFIRNFLPLENENSDLHARSVHDLCFRGNELWIATEDDGIYKLDKRYNSLTKYPASKLEDLYARSIYVDKDQRVWAIDHSGLKLYLDNEDRFHSYYADNNDPFDVRNNATGIMQDSQGNYWTIHSPSGVGLSIRRKGFRYFTDNTNNNWHSSVSNISALQEDTEGNLYIANPYNGIDIFNWSKNKTYRILHHDGDPESLGAGATFDLYWDHDGMWVATYLGGLQLMSRDFSSYTSYTNNPKDAKSIAGNDIRSVGYGADDNLWLSVHGKGVDLFSKKDKTFYHYTEKNSRLSSDWSFEVLEDSEGTVWVGTVFGLNRMLRDSSTFENYFSIPEDSSTLSDNEIVTVFEDSLKQIWVGTNSGLNLYNKEDNNFFRVKGELGTAFISSIQSDGNNDLWLGTYNGLYRYTHSSGKARKFDELDGLPSHEFSPRASYKNLHKELFFGTLNGVLLFDPDKLVYNSIKPHVVISGLKLFGKEITEFENSTIIDRPIRVAKSIHLDYNQNMISFEFMAINMIQPEKNQFAYILEPFDKEWHNVSTKREATYTNLDPGKYTFKVIASNNDDVWNYEGASIEVIVKPPWWLSWWFRMIILVVSATVIISFFLLRTRQLRHQKQLLANKVRKSTNELRVTNEQLKSKTDHLNETNTLLEERQQQILEQSEKLQELNTTKDRLFSIIAHDITNPFNSIMGFSELLNSTYNELNEEERREMAGTIHESSRRVYGLLDNLLNWAKAQTNRIIFDPHLFDLEILVKEALQVFRYMIEKKEIDLLIRNEKKTKAYVDEQMTTTILRNLISNAIKYTPNKGKITITIDQDEKHAYLSIHDTGIGMSEADCIGLFDLINASSKDGTNGEKGSGIGLILSRELIIKNNGELSVQSALGKGSTFKISLPLRG